jgi:hypothetical protein
MRFLSDTRVRRLRFTAGLAFLVGALFTGVAPASADIFISGTATGRTIAVGNGTFRIAGTYVDPAVPNVRGTYSGSYTELTTGYTSCRFLGFGSIHCGEWPSGPEWRCNLISGELTLSSQGKWVTLQIGNGDVYRGRVTAGVCLNATNPSIHDVYFLSLAGNPPWWPYAYAGISGGYGPVAGAEAYLTGTSTPLGGGVYADHLTLSAQLYSVLLP